MILVKNLLVELTGKHVCVCVCVKNVMFSKSWLLSDL